MDSYKLDSRPIKDYDHELQKLWSEHVKTTESNVLCESCGVREWFDKQIIDGNAKVRLFTAKVNKPINQNVRCGCPGSIPGKIDLNRSSHLPGCWVRKKLLTGRFTVDTSVTPEDFKHGYSLGVALTS